MFRQGKHAYCRVISCVLRKHLNVVFPDAKLVRHASVKGTASGFRRTFLQTIFPALKFFHARARVKKRCAYLLSSGDANIAYSVCIVKIDIKIQMFSFNQNTVMNNSTITRKQSSQTENRGNAQERALDLFAEMMIEKIETIQQDWKKPWFCNTSQQWPRSLTGRNYNGMNSLMLTMHCEKQGYKYPVFCTFDRVMGLNFKRTSEGSVPVVDADGNKLPRVSVTKGEKSFPVFITTFTVVGEDGSKIKYDDYRALSDDEKESYNVYPKLQVYNVFNIAQTNLAEARPELYAEIIKDFESGKPANAGDGFRFEPVDTMIADNKWYCPIKPTQGDNAYFSISKNEIVIPLYEQFRDGESYYSNLFHEMCHSTGTDELLKRLKPVSFGSKEYAREELVAELTAALTAQYYGMSKHIKDDSAAYLKSWLQSLKEDASFIKTVLLDVKHATAMLTRKIDEVAQSMESAPKGASAPSGEPKDEMDGSPMLKQFRDMKEKHPDALLLFRVGDFYEAYADDAKACAEVLGITLTQRNGGYRMAGFPYHALDTYLPKLIRSGKRIAICDKLETSAA